MFGAIGDLFQGGAWSFGRCRVAVAGACSTGSIPRQLGNLTGLKELGLSDNQLSGECCLASKMYSDRSGSPHSCSDGRPHRLCDLQEEDEKRVSLEV